MLKDKHIVILGLPKFDGPYESTNFTLAKMLSKHNTVYYVDNPYTWKDYFRLKGSEEFNRRAPYFYNKNGDVLATEYPNLNIIITAPVPSINFLPEGKLYRLFNKLNSLIVGKRVKKILEKRQVKEVIYINTFNFHYPGVVKYLDPSLIIYYCLDPIIVPFDAKHGLLSQDEIVKSSDVVICSSKQLADENIAKNPNTYFVPNAADIRHSATALSDDLEVHKVLQDIPKPMIGYFGNIERRMDYNLLKDVVESNPLKSFVFVGPQETGYMPDWIFKTANVYLPGRVPYSEMPAILKGFDVAILPFKKDEVSATIFPLKLFEYLGAGKPVVATNFNANLKEFTADEVIYCDNAPDFSTALEHAIKSDNLEKVATRTSIAANNTWEKRLTQIEGIILKHLALK